MYSRNSKTRSCLVLVEDSKQGVTHLLPQFHVSLINSSTFNSLAISLEMGGSKGAERLLAAQNANLSGILAQIESAGPARFEKEGHWAWYVWPTKKEGFSDPLRTAVEDANDAKCVLMSHGTRKMWEAILNKLAEALRVQRTRALIPDIDHGRIAFFCKEWSSQEYQEAAAEYPEFQRAYQQFCEDWAAATPAVISYPEDDPSPVQMQLMASNAFRCFRACGLSLQGCLVLATSLLLAFSGIDITAVLYHPWMAETPRLWISRFRLAFDAAAVVATARVAMHPTEPLPRLTSITACCVLGALSIAGTIWGSIELASTRTDHEAGTAAFMGETILEAAAVAYVAWEIHMIPLDQGGGSQETGEATI